jgi:hypothetical protein
MQSGGQIKEMLPALGVMWLEGLESITKLVAAGGLRATMLNELARYY